jgi:hypothetical protein
VEDLEDAGGEGADFGLRSVHGGMELCGAIRGAKSPAPGPTGGSLAEDTLDGGRGTETAMQHFHAGNRHKIKDAPPNTWATVDCRDVVTRSELARRGFHLVDMSGEVWTMRRMG